MCFSKPKMPKPAPVPVTPDIDESAQTATEEESRRRQSALGSKSTSIAGTMTPPSTAPKTAMGA